MSFTNQRLPHRRTNSFLFLWQKKFVNDITQKGWRRTQIHNRKEEITNIFIVFLSRVEPWQQTACNFGSFEMTKSYYCFLFDTIRRIRNWNLINEINAYNWAWKSFGGFLAVLKKCSALSKYLTITITKTKTKHFVLNRETIKS
jgi:hypothetical protein